MNFMFLYEYKKLHILLAKYLQFKILMLHLTVKELSK